MFGSDGIVLIEEALDQIAVFIENCAEGGLCLRFGMAWTLARTPRIAIPIRNASGSQAGERIFFLSADFPHHPLLTRQ